MKNCVTKTVLSRSTQNHYKRFSSFFDNFFKDSKNHQIVSKKNSKIVTSNSGPITSLSLCTYIFFSFSSNGSRGNEDSSHHASNTLQTLKRLSSLHHFYAKPWATQYFMPNEAAMRPKIEIMQDQEGEDGESW